MFKKTFSTETDNIGNNVQDIKRSELENRKKAIKDKLDGMDKSTEQLLPITELSLTEIQLKLKESTLTPLDLLHAFQAKGLQLIDQGNSGICEFIQEAEEQVNQLQKSKSALHGIPISVKEICKVKGYDATFALRKFCGKPSVEDCVVVQVLREIGAIPFILTATSQLTYASGFNPIFGNMFCPFSLDHEPGGSSTGEAVLIAQNGSPVGLGTDLAGSIRIPSAFCGICGLKPTTERVSNIGVAEIALNSALAIELTVGPMGKRVEDLVQVMRALLQPIMYKLDPTIPKLPFDESVYTDTTKLVIGYYDTLAEPDIVQTVPAVRRTVEKAINCLRDQGHQIIKFDIPNIGRAFELAVRALCSGGGQKIKQGLKSETLNIHSKSFIQLLSVPDTLRTIVDAGIRKTIGGPAAIVSHAAQLKNIVEVMKHLEKMKNYRKQFLSALENIDLLVCPAWSTPAPNINTPPHYINPAVVYTVLYNMLNLPAGVVTVAKVEEADLDETRKQVGAYKYTGDKFHEKLFNSQLDTKEFPVAVQVVGKPFCEEMVLRVMNELQIGCEASLE